MKLFRRSLDRPARRGQGMVEFALILPLLALLLVMAIDFGRVFFGWIALQNATRIAADLASQRAEAWPTAETGEQQGYRAEYELLITQDLQAANCSYTTPHPDPVFTNANAGDPDDGGDHDFGDLVTVTLDCDFGLITPLAETVVGGPVQLSATSTFPINGMIVVGVPDPPVAPPEPCVAPVASFDSVPPPTGGGRVNGSVSPFLVSFTSTTDDDPDCPITEYLWERRTGSSGPWTEVGTTDELLNESFTDAPGGGNTEYQIRLTVTSDEGSDDEIRTIRVSA